MADDKPDQTQGSTGQAGKKSPTAAATDMARTAAGAATSMGQTAAQAAQAMTRAGMDAATNMGQTAARAAQDMTRTAAGAATSMGHAAGQAAGEMGRTASGGGMTGMTGMGAMPGVPGMAEFTRMFSEMKMPAVPDMEQFLSAYRRNMEVLSQANRVALEGAQSVARRHMEMMQQAMAEMTESMRQLSSPDSPQARTAKQAEMMKAAYERAVAHMREMADLIQRSNGEALGLLNQRFTEAMDEVKSMAQKAGRPQG